MTIEQYQDLTGTTVPDDQVIFVTAQIVRARKILEGMLGYPLTPKKIRENLYNELGKTTTDCPCPEIDTDDLEDPDDVEFAYRTFSYNSKDQYFFVDPFTEVFAVKLVWNDVTIKTFEVEDWRAQMAQGWGKFIENCQRTVCFCVCTNTCAQLAIDASWLNACELDDIKYIWADMAKYYADCKKDIKSESIGSHSYTKNTLVKPQDDSQAISVLRKYAGPNGSLTKVVVV